jgi:hypothetical protein
MTCPDCTAATREPWDGFTAGCKGCDARALGRTFLSRGERGQRLRRGCEQLGVTEQQVRDAWAQDASNPERRP